MCPACVAARNSFLFVNETEESFIHLCPLERNNLRGVLSERYAQLYCRYGRDVSHVVRRATDGLSICLHKIDVSCIGTEGTATKSENKIQEYRKYPPMWFLNKG